MRPVHPDTLQIQQDRPVATSVQQVFNVQPKTLLLLGALKEPYQLYGQQSVPFALTDNMPTPKSQLHAKRAMQVTNAPRKIKTRHHAQQAHSVKPEPRCATAALMGSII